MLSEEKKLTVKRLVIFVLLSFIPCYILLFIGNSVCEAVTDTLYSVFTFLIMFTPLAANLLTRSITKEGMKNSFLQINFKGHEKYYILAALLPFCYILTGSVFKIIFLGEHIALGENLAEAGATKAAYFSAAVTGISTSFLLLPVYMGEEFGWRAYMTPKLKQLMNEPLAYLVGGFIWGLWHAPAIAFGFNVGLDYFGYPWTGILLMCLFCTGAGIIFTWLVEKTNSVYPAALAHAVNNTEANLLSLLTSSESSAIAAFAALTAGVFVIAAACIAEKIIAAKKAPSA